MDQYTGLLGAMPQQDQNMGLGLLGLAVLANNRGRNSREALQNAIGGGSQQGLAFIQQSLANQSRQKQLAMQQQGLDQSKNQFDQTFGLQRQSFEAQQAERLRLLQQQQQFAEAVRQGMTPQTGAPVGAMGLGSGLGQSAPPPMPQQPNINEVLGRIQMQNPQLSGMIKDYRAAMPEVGSTQEVVGPDGTPQKLMIDKQGNRLGNLGQGYQAQFDPRVIPAKVAEENALIQPRVALETLLGPIKANTARAGRTEVNLAVNTDKTLTGQVADLVGKRIGETNTSAASAVSTINTANRIREVLNSGNVITGPGANAITTLTQIGSALGVTGKDATERLQNTRVLMQNLAGAELAAAESMKGQGQITENERALIKRAAGGDVSMTAPELKALADSLDKVARSKIRSNNQQVDQLSRNPQFGTVLPQFMRIEEPPAFNGGFRVLGPEK